MSALVARLARQLRSKGVKNSAGVAVALAKKAGNVDAKGKLTAQGKKRQSMGKAGRAKARSAKYSGHKASAFKYNSNTNRATLKK